MLKMVPRLARIALGLKGSVRGSASTTASNPAASALRSTAPTLPGFSTSSKMAISGFSGSFSAASVGRGISATASTPSERLPKANFSNTGSVTSDELGLAATQLV